MKYSRVLILSEWDIGNEMIFYAVSKEKEIKFNTEEEVKEAHKGVEYINDHKALVIWLIQKRDRKRLHETSNVEHIGILVVYIVEEVDSERVVRMSKEVVDFGVKVATKDKNKFIVLNAKFEKILEAYDERGRKINEMEKNHLKLTKATRKEKVGRRA